MKRDQVVGLMLQCFGTGLNVCGALLDDRQTQLFGSQIRHVGRVRSQRALRNREALALASLVTGIDDSPRPIQASGSAAPIRVVPVAGSGHLAAAQRFDS